MLLSEFTTYKQKIQDLALPVEIEQDFLRILSCAAAGAARAQDALPLMLRTAAKLAQLTTLAGLCKSVRPDVQPGTHGPVTDDTLTDSVRYKTPLSKKQNIVAQYFDKMKEAHEDGMLTPDNLANGAGFCRLMSEVYGVPEEDCRRLYENLHRPLLRIRPLDLLRRYDNVGDFLHAYETLLEPATQETVWRVAEDGKTINMQLRNP